MRLEFLFPKEIEKAKKENTPLVIPVGTIEYHGPHCSFGCDTLIPLGLLEKLEAEKEMVIAPAIWYSPSSYAVAGPDKGTVHVDCDVFEQYVYSILKSLLYGGWKNIYLLIHHQYEQENMMPMTLSCAKAAKKLIFEYLEVQRGIGWWGSNDSASYYENLGESDDPFQWIKVLPCMSRENQNAAGYDHAGKYETSFQAALFPESVKMDRIKDSDEWFIQSAAGASVELGNQMTALCLEDLRQKIK